MNGKNEKQHFNELAQKHASQWWGNRTETGQYREKYRVELFTGKIKDLNKSKVLEIGCASGDFTFKLAEKLKQDDKSAEIFAIDVSDGLIGIAKKRNYFNNVFFLEGDVEKLSFPDRFFDVVCGNAVLHHLNLGRALPEVKRVLKSGGKIIFFEPNLLNPQVFLEKKIKFIGRLSENSSGETAFTKRFIEKELSGFNFKNIKVANFDFYHPLIPFFFVRNFNFVFKIPEKLPLLKNISGSLFIYGEK